MKLGVASVVVIALAWAASVSAAPAVTHPPRVKGQSSSNSLNWAGYAVTGSFNGVAGTWTQPGASCSSSFSTGKPNGHGHHGQHGHKSPYTAASFWIGLDGYSSPTVEQIGTEADCNGTTPSYYAWYELYPAGPVNLQQEVAPGDVLQASVSVDSGTGTLTLTDKSEAHKGWTATEQFDASGLALSSAEWIVEAPSHGRSLPLTDFGSVAFTGATAGGAALGGSSSADEITMITHNGTVRAAPSALSGDGFTVTWEHS